MSNETTAPNAISVETFLLEDGEVRWVVTIDGEDHGEGRSPSHAQAFREVAGYMQDRGWSGGAS